MKLLFRETEKQSGTTNTPRKIRCPKCKWQVGKHDRWSCLCGHVWNTFDTHGTCPGCNVAWRDTQCLKCQAWSPHDEWYGDDDTPYR